MKILFSVFILLLCNDSFADSLVFGGISKHVGYEEGVTFNERNNAIGYEYSDISLVAYKNSYSSTSLALYYTQSLLSYKILNFGVSLGGVTGYNNTPVNKPLLPIFAPTLNIELYKSWSTDLSYQMTSSDTGVFTLNLRYSLF